MTVNTAVQNIVLGNLIGTDLTGQVAKANGLNGIQVSGARQTAIGGVGANGADRNVISGNAAYGIDITAAVNTQVLGNYIGTDKGGNVEVGNLKGGIAVEGSSTGTQIGGALGQGGILGPAGNVISGNKKVAGQPVTGNGIYLANGSSLTTIQGNYIGTDRTGMNPLGNKGDGIYVAANSTNNIIGGTAGNLGNLISANTGVGIDLVGGNNFFDFNIVGLDTNGGGGNPALSNGLGWLVNTGFGNTDGGHNQH